MQGPKLIKHPNARSGHIEVGDDHGTEAFTIFTHGLGLSSGSLGNRVGSSGGSSSEDERVTGHVHRLSCNINHLVAVVHFVDDLANTERVFCLLCFRRR